MDVINSQELFLLSQIKEQNEKLLKQNEELLKINRQFLPISELPFSQEEKEYLFSRGAKVLGDLLAPNFFNAAEAKQWQSIIKRLREWGYSPIISGDMKIEEMDFEVRTKNALIRSKVIYLLDLVSMKEQEVKKIRNLGAKSLAEIHTKLQLLGYDW